jgi:hypothetical protein
LATVTVAVVAAWLTVTVVPGISPVKVLVEDVST